MKIEQENSQFKPITITLETKSEAEAFFGLIDKMTDPENRIANCPGVSPKENDLLTNLWVAFCNKTVNI